MKSRNREVNIFNMSLLDILCGALGAFCFMMLVLFPYWKPKGATAEDIARKYQQMSQEMDQLRNQLSKLPGGGGDLKERLDKITKNFQQQQRELEQAKAENDQLKMRRPMVVSLNWSSPSHKVDLYVRYRGKTKGGAEMEQPDASKSQGRLFAGDLVTDCFTGPCSDTWLTRDVPIGGEFEVYYKFMDANGNPAPARINAAFVTHEGGFWLLPVLDMPQPKTIAFAGVLRYDRNEKLIFLPQPEYAAQFREANKERLAQTPK
jgi:hypothetical protein